MLKKTQSITLEADSYTLIKLINEGEQDVIWQVTATSTGRSCILKTIRTHEVSASRRMQEEIDFLRTVQTDKKNCFIAPYLDHGVIDHNGLDLPAVVMPHYPQNLQQQIPRHIHQHPEYDLPMLLSWLTQLSQALQCTHEQIIDGHVYMHHDIKPSNIFLTENNEIRLMNFGIAKQQDDAKGTTSIAHSSTWVAPEQVLPKYVQDNGDNIFRLTEKTDLYSLGLIAYYLYTAGEKPKTQTNFIDRQRNQAIYNRHVMSLKAGKDGQLGKVGGLSKKDKAYLHRRLFSLFFTQNKTKTSPIQPKDSLPLPYVMSKEILAVTSQLLLPQADKRPSAAIIKQQFQRLQRCFSPRLDDFTIISNKNDFFIGDALEVELHLNGQGLTAPFDWLQVHDQNEQLFSFNILSVTPNNTIFLAEENRVRLRLAAFENTGEHHISIIAAIGDQTHTVETVCNVQASASQLWKKGQHEAALRKDLRVEWLDVLKKRALSSAKARTDYLQLLKTLQESATNDKQKSRLATFYQDATVIKKPFWQTGLVIVVGIALLGGVLFKIINNQESKNPEVATTSSNEDSKAVTQQDAVLTSSNESESSEEAATQPETDLTIASENDEEMTTQLETDAIVTSESNEEMTTQLETDAIVTSESNEEMTAQPETDKMVASESSEEMTAQPETDAIVTSESSEEITAQSEADTTVISENSEEKDLTVTNEVSNKETQQQNPTPPNERRANKTSTPTKEVTSINESSNKVTKKGQKTTPDNANNKDFSEKEVNAIQSLLN